MASENSLACNAVIIDVKGDPRSPPCSIRVPREGPHHHRVSKPFWHITLPGQRLPDNVGFHLSLIIQIQVAKVRTTHARLRFTVNISFRPNVRNTVRAWLDDRYNVCEGVGFFDVSDDNVDNVTGGGAWDKDNLAVNPTQAVTAMHYLANLKGEGLAPNRCHLISLRNDVCAGVFGVHVSSQTAHPHPGGAHAGDS